MVELVRVQQSILHHGESITSNWHASEMKDEHSKEEGDMELWRSLDGSLEASIGVNDVAEHDLNCIDEP